MKNLNFDTSEATLKEHFEQVGKIESVKISRKRDSTLSNGFGFVTFKLASSAEKALKTLQHKQLDDHCLELKRSKRNVEEDKRPLKRGHATGQNEEASSKILVRNVPFQANEKEIREIFKTFGTLKSTRLPKKATGSHRGFAFVEFHVKEEAKKAFDALCHSTHLYGRRLVLEWAAQEADSIDELRRKTAQQFDPDFSSAKRAKKAEIMQSVIMSSKD